MIEEGLVKLVQGNVSVAAIAVGGGGFLAELPKNQTLPSWTHMAVSEPGEYTLTGRQSLRKRRAQIDCFAADPDEAILLARAINLLLDGYRGTLTDADNTVVQGCFRSNVIDFFDDAPRTYRRMLEYEIWFIA